MINAQSTEIGKLKTFTLFPPLITYFGVVGACVVVVVVVVVVVFGLVGGRVGAVAFEISIW